MSDRLQAYERKERREKKRREKEAKLKKQQEQEEKQKNNKEYRPYAWREILERKDRPKQPPPSVPEHSTTSKYAKAQSPVQKLLRQSPSSKVKASPSTPIDPKWIISSNRKTSSNQYANRHSNGAKTREESPQKAETTKAVARSTKRPPATTDSDDDESSDEDLLAFIRSKKKKSEQDGKKISQESMKSALDEENEGDRTAKKSTRKRSRGSMDSGSSSEDVGDKSSRRQSNRESNRGDSDSLSEEDTESQGRNRQKSSRLWLNRKKQGSRGIVFSSEDEIEEYSEGHHRKSSGKKSNEKKSTRKHSQEDDSDFLSEDENISQVSSRCRGNRGTNQERRKGGNSKYKNPVDSSSDEEEKPASRKLFSNSSDDDEAKKATKPVLNPFTVAQREQQSFESIAANFARSTTEADDDLWSDMEEDADNQKADKSKSKKSKKRSRSSSSTRDSNERPRSIEKSSPSPSKTGGASYWYLPDSDDRYEITKLLAREDEEALRSIIHPELENPEWSFEYKVLELGKGTESAASVPASLSRYLASYQKDGIRFMHKCLAAKSGTIMGDEMGLGKTVQVIGLLCALFKKTGTGLDLLRIHRRNKLITQQRAMAIREEKKAMMDGRIYKPKKIDAKSLDLPAWYPVLIIVPPSVVENWQNEFERFSNFAVAIFSGARGARDRALDMIRDGRAEVLIAAKSLFQEKRGANELNEISWKLVIIDEFHTFKNVKGNVSTHLRKLKADHQPLVLGMTGTLMQNDHKELWNLIDLVETNYLGTWKEFEAETARAIKLGRQKGANEQTIVSSKRKSKALEEHLAKIFIARKKEDVVADKLTKKTVNVVFCPPSEIQKRVYANILTLPDVQHVKMATSPCDCGVNRTIFKRFFKLQRQADRVRYIRDNQKDIMKRGKCCYAVPINPRRNEEGQPLIDPDAVIWRMLDGHDETSDDPCPRCPYCVLFSVLDKLNKLSSHVGSLQADRSKGIAPRGSEEYVRFTKELEFAKVAFPPDIVEKLPGGLYRQDAVMNEHFLLSGKMKELHQLLKRYKKESCKVLVFSYSTKTLDFIEQYVRSENHSFLRIDGQVQSKLRQDLCNRFNKDRNIFLFLLSTKACGLGLNLTAANKVIIFDVEWNPSWDEQAQDRAYRIGQQNDVEVIRLVTEGTVDELKYLRQLYKVQLKNETLNSSEAKARSARVFRGIQGDKDRKGELFGTENLLKLKADGSFLADLWKSKMPNGKSDTSKEVGVHNVEDITSNLNSDLCDKLFDPDSANAAVAYMESQGDSGEYDSACEDEKMHPSSKNRQEQSQDGEKEEKSTADRNLRSGQGQDDRQASRQVDEESPSQRVAASRHEVIDVSDGEDGHLANAVNQDALYDEEQGGALYEEGDDGYDEEMGGETQNAYASYATMRFPENPQDGTFDDDDEGGNHGPDQNIARLDAVARRQEAMAASAARRQASGSQIRAAMQPMEDGVPRMPLVMRPNSPALDERTEGGRETKEEGHPISHKPESMTSVQLRPEPVDASKEDFFRSRGARGTTESDGDDLEGGGRVAKKPITNRDDSDGDSNASGGRVAKRPKTETGDSDGNDKKPPKKKAPINLFGKTTTASKSNSKGVSGLYIPTYKKSRKKKKK